MNGKRVVGLAMLAALVAAWGCGEDKFVIRHWRPAKIQVPDRIRKVAIVGFKEKEDLGDVVIGKMASRIRASERFALFDRDSLNSSDTAPPEIAAYVTLAPDSGPWLIVTTADGSILWQGVPPLTTAAILALVPFPKEAPSHVR